MIDQKKINDASDINLPNILGSYRFNSKINNWFDTESYAEVIFKPKNEEDLINFLKNISKEKRINIVGAASNIIFKDKITNGVIIKLSAEFAKIKHCNDIITAGAAAFCRNVAIYGKNNSLANLEFLSGIPGTIGGAIAMNAGCYGGEISDFLIEAKALDINGNLIILKNEDFGFFYRGSNLIKNKELFFLSASFQCVKQDEKIIDQKINDLVNNREKTQPIRAKTGGSTFKNPQDCKAWELIDKAGYRGFELNNVKVSDKHCNFLINLGNASGDDIIKLIKIIQDDVKAKFDTVLETEIKII